MQQTCQSTEHPCRSFCASAHRSSESKVPIDDMIILSVTVQAGYGKVSPDVMEEQQLLYGQTDLMKGRHTCLMWNSAELNV